MKKLTASAKKEIWGNFSKFQTAYLATYDGKTPRVRPVSLGCIDSRLWVFTSAGSKKAREMAKDPAFEFCYAFKGGEHSGYIRASGKARIVKDRRTKAKMVAQCPFFKEYWKGPDDPEFALVELLIKEIEYLKPGEMYPARYKL
ncbi:MAG: pyridoxamine 5'-phosphate oxidase family protein [Euryarchaeota archaeon]|nr:pyridoxamine 5'-phosphate oxidase family protein [Euryarchaeota archaeon]